MDELRRISEEPVAADDLSTAKNYLSGTFVMRLETQESLAAQIAGTKLMGLPLEYLEQYTASVRAVDAGRIPDAAALYMRPDDAAIVVVGDAGALAPQLTGFGEVVVEKAAEAQA
jgi:zinc protease